MSTRTSSRKSSSGSRKKSTSGDTATTTAGRSSSRKAASSASNGEQSAAASIDAALNSVKQAATSASKKAQRTKNDIQSNPTSYATTAAWIVSNVITSVGIILVNKHIMGHYKFRYVFSLTALHYFVTGIGMEVLSLAGYFQRKGMSVGQTLTMALFGIGSVGFMNFSLQYNSVGMYQILKLCTIPCMVVVQQYIRHTAKFSRKIQFTLIIVLIGVAIATVTDVQLNTVGSLMGFGAVIFTTQFQIWQGEKQKQFSLGPMQINHALALPSAFLCALLALVFEATGKSPVQSYNFTQASVSYILLSAALALAVNLCSYGLIGSTSPVTYQVVGHAKTCLVLLGGYLMQPINDPTQLLKNLSGIITAMVGVVVYGQVKMKEGTKPKEADVYDQILPRQWSKWLDQK